MTCRRRRWPWATSQTGRSATRGARPVLLLFCTAVLGLPQVTLIELRLALISYQDYHKLLLTLADAQQQPARLRHFRHAPRVRKQLEGDGLRHQRPRARARALRQREGGEGGSTAAAAYLQSAALRCRARGGSWHSDGALWHVAHSAMARCPRHVAHPRAQVPRSRASERVRGGQYDD